MQSDNNNNIQESIDNRRKRINRLKKLIVFAVILFILLPIICCIILGIQVNRLQKQVDDMSAQYGMNNPADDVKDESFAYAAVKSDHNNTIIIPSITPFIQNNGMVNTPVPGVNTYISDNKDNVTADKDEAAIADKNNAVSDTKENTNIDTENKESDIKENNITDDKKKAADTDNTNKSKDTDKGKGSKSDEDKSTGIYAGKKVYLTFDDGPSDYTAEILDTLAEFKVKATFFVIGKTDDQSKEMYKRIVNEGHTLGMHSYSHKYATIYNSVEDFDKDFTKLWKLLYDTTGYKPSIYRFPGGSDNLVNRNGMDEFIHYLNEKNIVYFDWNVVSGDATNVEYTKKQLVDNILNGVAVKERSIVLMHDAQAKKSTADSLPKLIEALVSGGAQILPLDNTVAPIQMIKADSVK